MELLSKTNLTFQTGQRLTTSDLNTLNDTINNLVDAVNSFIKSSFDVNKETANFTKTYTLTDAINLVASRKRSLGMKVRFLGKSNKYEEYSYTGTSVNDDDFLNIDNWETGYATVDGGEW